MTRYDGPPYTTPQKAIATALRRERARSGRSLTEVARCAGIAKSTLSQLESGTGNPSIETLWALCVALDVPFSHLLDPPRPRVRVIRAGVGSIRDFGPAEYRATLLSVSPPNVRRDIYRITAEPGYPRESDPHPRGVIEHLILGTGCAKAGLVESPVVLESGDYICYPGDLPHVFEALESGTWAMLISENG